jgi:trans-aconitate methyltransferase
MDAAEGARTFLTTGNAYDLFMGRYSRPLAVEFANSVGVAAGMSALDVGCGPGALTTVLVDRLGAAGVVAMDPSPPFVAECSARHSGVDVRLGRAEQIPFADACVDVAMAQLVLHFVSDPTAAAREMRRVVRPGGTVAACVWDFAKEMEMLRLFWDSALAVDPNAPDEARTLRFGGSGEIADLLTGAGLVDVVETTLTVSASYQGFDELWEGFLGGIGPAGTFCLSLLAPDREAVLAEMFRRLGSPTGTFSLTAVARSAQGKAPG